MTIASTVPIGGLMMPLPQLSEKGVFVMTGTDSVIDHWSPFGSGDMLEKANLYAQLYRGRDEFRLSRAMAIATGGVLPLDDQRQARLAEGRRRCRLHAGRRQLLRRGRGPPAGAQRHLPSRAHGVRQRRKGLTAARPLPGRRERP